MNWETRHILIAEDNEDDFFLLTRALKKAEVANPVHRVKNGHEAIQYLAGTSPFADRIAYPFPDLMLLDLKMPHKHGFDVLDWMRHRENTKTLPVIILSSSQENTDIRKAYELGANGFVPKSTSVGSLTEVITAIQQFWLKVNATSRPPK